MSVLTQKEIIKQIKKRKVKIEPFVEKNVGPASIDLTLDNKFRIFTKGSKINVDENSDYTKITKPVTKDKIVMKKGEMILGITKEKVTLPDNICGLLEGRSRFARLGVLVHVSSAFVQPGVSNQQVLEIVNLGGRDVELKAGTKVCQLLLIRTEGRAEYKGIFQGQNKP